MAYYFKLLLGFIFIIYFLIIIILYLQQNRLIFIGAYSFKDRLKSEQFLSKNLEKQILITKDKTELNGAIYKNNNDKLIIYFGGNASNSIGFLNTFTSYYKNYDIVSFNYRGFAYSKGNPSEKKLYSDSIEIYNKYKNSYKEIVIIGRSLGTAIATYLSKEVKVSNLILITPFDSIQNIAQKQFFYIPIKYILNHKFNLISNIKNNKTPCSVVIVKDDKVVSNKNTKNLIDNIFNLKNIITIENSTHNNISTNIKVLEFIRDTIK